MFLDEAARTVNKLFHALCYDVSRNNVWSSSSHGGGESSESSDGNDGNGGNGGSNEKESGDGINGEEEKKKKEEKEKKRRRKKY